MHKININVIQSITTDSLNNAQNMFSHNKCVVIAGSTRIELTVFSPNDHMVLGIRQTC